MNAYDWHSFQNLPVIPKDGCVLGFVSTYEDKQKNIIDLQSDVATSSLIQSILGTAIDVKEFLDIYWRVRPVLIKGSSKRIDGIKEIFNDLSVMDMLESTASDSIQCWLKSTESNSLSSIQCNEAEQAFKLYQAGHSLYCRAPRDLEDLVITRIMDELGNMNFHN